MLCEQFEYSMFLLFLRTPWIGICGTRACARYKQRGWALRGPSCWNSTIPTERGASQKTTALRGPPTGTCRRSQSGQRDGKWPRWCVSQITLCVLSFCTMEGIGLRVLASATGNVSPLLSSTLCTVLTLQTREFSACWLCLLLWLWAAFANPYI